MTDFDKGVTIGVARAQRDRHTFTAAQMHKWVAERHKGPHDLIVMAVPPGTGQEARHRIWEALDTTPVDPQPDDGVLAATSPDQDFIRRAYIGP